MYCSAPSLPHLSSPLQVFSLAPSPPPPPPRWTPGTARPLDLDRCQGIALPAGSGVSASLPAPGPHPLHLSACLPAPPCSRAQVHIYIFIHFDYYSFKLLIISRFSVEMDNWRMVNNRVELISVLCPRAPEPDPFSLQLRVRGPRGAPGGEGAGGRPKNWCGPILRQNQLRSRLDGNTHSLSFATMTPCILVNLIQIAHCCSMIIYAQRQFHFKNKDTWCHRYKVMQA